MRIADILARSAAGGEIDRNGKASLFAPGLQPVPLPITKMGPVPCTNACPAGVNAKAYVSLIAEERFAEAIEVVRQRCTLPGICGRICTHPCEQACTRNDSGGPIAIRALKRFVADIERELPRPSVPPVPERNKKVAIIGSGPAGLTAAYDLRRAGFPVTIFESAGMPGGMLRYGIAEYRLPLDIVDYEIDVILRTGVEIRTGVRLGTDLDLEELPAKGYNAVLLAVGAQAGRRLGVPGEGKHPEVSDALAFLRKANEGDRTPVGKTVVVIGGGSTAIEAARMALRLGAESVEILYRRSPDELLASREEVEEAKAEGVKISFLVAPTRVITQGKRFAGLECSRVGLGELDKSGRRRPIIIPGTEFRVKADRVFAAVGQEIEHNFFPSQSRTRLFREGRLVVDAGTSLTRLTRVFAAGDMVGGPATVIDAIAGGHRAAAAIRRLLEEGQAAVSEMEMAGTPEEYMLPDEVPVLAPRVRQSTLALAPGKEFAEVEQPFTREEAVAEARRCLRCGPCDECRICVPTCHRRHIMVREVDEPAPGTTALLRVPASVSLSLDFDGSARGWILPQAEAKTLPNVKTSEGKDVEILPVRARVIEERCRACASCVEVCPFGAITVGNGDGAARRRARIEPALCRGCNLCTAVCPTRAAVPAAPSYLWWGRQMGDALTEAAGKGPGPNEAIVLACERRAGTIEQGIEKEGARARVIRCRCIGQVDAGMLLDLVNKGGRRVHVVGCGEDSCRFVAGAALAREQVERARSMLRFMGRNEGSISADWSPGTDRFKDPIAQILRQLEPPQGAVPVAG